MAVAVGSMKKFLNDPEAVVKESLAGLAAAHGDLLRYDADAQIVVRAGAPTQGKVALVSAIGNGATHWNQLIPVYILPGLVGASLAAFAYDFLATPRIVTMPIQEAVTHPDPLAGDVAPSH